MAQLGSARRSGRRGRRFKSCHPDHLSGAATAAPESFPAMQAAVRLGSAAGQDDRVSADPDCRPPHSPPRSPPAGRPGSARRGSPCPTGREDAPHRCLYASDVSGVVEQYAWDRQTDEHRQVTDRPNGTLIGHAEPGRRARSGGSPTPTATSSAIWLTQPFAGGQDARRRRRGRCRPIPPGWRSAAPWWRSAARPTTAASCGWRRTAAAPRVDLPAPRPGRRRRAHPRRRAARPLALRARRPALPGPAGAPDADTTDEARPSSPRSGTARAAACTRWSSARCPTTGGCWSATSGAAARSC